MRMLLPALAAAFLAVSPAPVEAQQEPDRPMTRQQGPGGPMQRPDGDGPRRGPEFMGRGGGPDWGHGDRGRGRMMMRHPMGPGMLTMMMILVDTDGSGTLSLEEVQAVHARIFNYADANDDGQLTEEELRGFFQGRRFGDDDRDD
jgi:hypothetical protein